MVSSAIIMGKQERVMISLESNLANAAAFKIYISFD